MTGKVTALFLFLSILLTDSAQALTSEIMTGKPEDSSNIEFFIVDHKSDSSSTETGVIDTDEIRTMPVSGIIDIVEMQTGVTDCGGRRGEISPFGDVCRSNYLIKISAISASSEHSPHFRGGRSGEVLYIVDGVVHVDPIDNTFSSDIPLSSIYETTITTGGFDAEYGNAQSGIVDIVEREGGSSCHGGISLSGNDWESLGLASDWTWHRRTPWGDAKLNSEAFVSGPEPISTYLLPAIGVHIPGEIRFFAAGEYNETGGGENGRYGFGFDDWSTAYSGNLKLTYRPTSRTRINITGFYLDKTSGWFGIGDYWAWSKFEDIYIDNEYGSETYGDTLALGSNILYALPTRFRENYSIGLGITHMLSDAADIEIRLNRFQSSFEYRIRNDPDGSYDTEWLGENFTEEDWLNYSPERTMDYYGFYREGTSRFVWNESRSTVSTFGINITGMLNKEHHLKTGIEVKHYNVFHYNVIADSAGSVHLNRYHASPNSGSIFLQDRICLNNDDMFMNAGLRLDYFDPNPDGSSSNQLDPTENPEASVKYYLSPRLGFTYPLGERHFMYFSYGHYSQMPEFSRIFSGADYSFSEDIPIVGYLDLLPEKTVSYEAGLSYQINNVSTIDICGYIKNISALTGTRRIQSGATEEYDLYVNNGYGNVRGSEITYSLHPRGFFKGNLSYSYSIAKGRNSIASQNYIYSLYGWNPPSEEHYLDWDQRHTINAELDFRIPRGEGPRIGNTPFLEGFGMHLSWNFGSGFPYTASNQGTEIPVINTRRYPSTMMASLKVNKNFWIGSFTLDAWFQVYNLFNRQNIDLIMDIEWYEASGYIYDSSLDPDPTGVLDNPYAYGMPRMVQFGLGIEW
ncbi:MAG: TonB-dependent receptor plug domain-containing protein [Candidatus Aegiribacteria sp.]|nr:TonB-dependent receptor plug domain-containing protein [Candidatus Aegiribacteria sp.]